MKREICLLIGFAVAISFVALSGAQVLAQAPPGQPDLQADPFYADYVDTLAYWFQYNYEDDWQTRLSKLSSLPLTRIWKKEMMTTCKTRNLLGSDGYLERSMSS